MAETKGRKAAAPAPRRETLSVTVPSELAERLRDAVHFERLTLSGLAAAALHEHLARMVQRRGRAFPRRPAGPLPAGRPIRGSRPEPAVAGAQR